MYTESNVKLSCNALWQKCVLATLYRAAATHPEIKLLQLKLIPGQGINKAILDWPPESPDNQYHLNK